jgi:hypothetical protein
MKTKLKKHITNLINITINFPKPIPSFSFSILENSPIIVVMSKTDTKKKIILY